MANIPAPQDLPQKGYRLADVNTVVVGQNQPPAGVSEGGSIDFGALKAQAAAMLPDDDAPLVEAPVVPATPAPTEVRVKGSGESEPPPAKTVEPAVVVPVVEAAAAAKSVAIGDDDLVDVVVDGESQQLPWKEARGKISGGLKFTQNMQQVAAARKALEAEQANIALLKTEAAQMRAFLESPKVLEYAQRTFGQATAPQGTQPPAATNPDEIATLGDARSIAEQQTAQFVAKLTEQSALMDQKIQEATQRLEFDRQKAAHSISIQTTLTDIFDKNPVLKAIPNAEDLIRYNVAQLSPKTEAEALAAFHQVANGIVEEIGKHTKQTQKAVQIAAAKQKLETASIEPAGGSAPQLAPTNYKNQDGSVNWDVVRKSASAMLG